MPSEKQKRKQKIKKTELELWKDENFYYAAGYTPGGVPFGITWDEYERDIKEDKDKQDEVYYNIEEEKNDNDFLDRDIFFKLACSTAHNTELQFRCC